MGQLVMLGIGLVAFAAGIAILLRSRSGSDAQRYGRRMVGSMMAALGAALTVFALGLAGKLEAA